MLKGWGCSGKFACSKASTDVQSSFSMKTCFSFLQTKPDENNSCLSDSFHAFRYRFWRDYLYKIRGNPALFPSTSSIFKYVESIDPHLYDAVYPQNQVRRKSTGRLWGLATRGPGGDKVSNDTGEEDEGDGD